MEDLQEIAYKFREIKNVLTSFYMRVLPNYQVSPIMMYTLEFLNMHPESKAVDIANEFGLTRGAVTQLLDKLEKRELVKRKPHPESRRSLQIDLTEMGIQLCASILSEYNKEIESLFTPYNKEELHSLRELLKKLEL